jgi:tRNA pseudouridine55 synthase
VDKPAGPTSHDAVAAVRRALGERRVGHAGTLDPPASGLLVVLVGRATRLARFTAGLVKRYAGTIQLGTATSTDDATGDLVAGPDEAWRGMGLERVRAALATVMAQPMQLPPAVSAKKVGGERAYRVTRRGGAPDLHPVPVTVHRLDLVEAELAAGLLHVAVECSAGTYVRAIARDVGRALGSLAHLASLRRTGIGPWSVDAAVALDRLGPDALRPMAEAVAHLPAVSLGAEAATKLTHGQRVEGAGAPEGPVAVFAPEGLVAVADARDGVLRPDVVLVR